MTDKCLWNHCDKNSAYFLKNACTKLETSPEKHESYEVFESHEMMTELPGSGRKGLDIICMPNNHYC